jgi:N-acetylglucosaminyldiphosphoundecaprenol N-acetyl-beta-D-mannosaminyltransferase
MDARIRRTVTTGVRVDAIPSLRAAIDLIGGRLRRGPFLTTFVNPGTVVLAQRNPTFAGMLDRFDLVAPDGIATARAIHWLHHLSAERISFDNTSLAPLVLQLAVEQNASMVLCGGRPGVAEQARRQLLAAFPGLRVVQVFDGYEDHFKTASDIARLNPEMVICGMGAVAQEAFLLSLVQMGWSGIGFTCGGFLDQLNAGLQYYPRFIDKMNLRWAYRLAKEPRRLWRRYLLDYPVFAASLARAMIRK